MTFPEIEQRYYSKRDLADRYRVSTLTIWRWERDGKIPKGVYVGQKKDWSPDMVKQADQSLLSAKI